MLLIFHWLSLQMKSYQAMAKYMKGNLKDNPMFDDIFYAAEIGELVEDQLTAYSQSRHKLEDDRNQDVRNRKSPYYFNRK